MTVLFINGHDYTRYVADDGYDWSRDDLDSEKTKRVRSGKLRRDKITEKRNLTFKMLPMPEALAAKLRQVVDKGNLLWDGISFNLHEI